MQISLVVGLTLLAGAQAHLWSEPALKLISRPKEHVTSNYTWTISDWDANCAESGCFSDFNVSAAAWKTSIPAFSASCSAGPQGAAYQRCDILDDETETHIVSARLLPVKANGTRAHLAVSYEFVDPNAKGTYWNYTAFATAPYTHSESGSARFSVTPSEIWGVA